MKTKQNLARWGFFLFLTVNFLTGMAQGPYPNTGNQSVCLNSTQPYGVINTVGSTYAWSITPSIGGTITGNGNSSISVTWTTVGTYTLQVTETLASGCVGLPVTIVVTVDPLPVPTITGNTPVCQNSTGNVYTTQSGMTNYIWNVVGGTITSGGTGTNNTVTVTWTTVGIGTVSVNYTDANGCTATNPTIFNVTVHPLPVPTITGPLAACQNSTGNVYSTQTGMTNYIWNVVGGTITGGTGTNSITVTWTTVGTETVSVNYNNGNGCSAAIPTVFNVTVNPLPVPAITGNTPVCQNSSGNVYTTQTGMTNYIWTVIGGTITAGGTGTDNTVTVTWTTVGTESVGVVYTNSNGCTAANPTVFNVTVNPLPVPTITGPLAACQNSTGNVYSTQATMSNYVWTVVGGTITGGIGTDAIVVTWTTVGTESVSVTYTDGNGCTAANPATYNVTVHALPVPTITGNTPVCKNSTGNIYTTQTGMTNYVWTVVGGTITAGGTATDNTVTVTWTTVGTGTVSVNYNDANGCTAANPTVFNVTVDPLPVPTITGPTPVCQNSPGNIYTTQTGMTNYVWAVVGGTITAGGTSTDNTVTITWNTVGVQAISVNYTNGNGCTAATPTVYNVTVTLLPNTSPIYHN